MPSPNYIGDLAQHVLNTLITEFAEQEVDLPSLRYITAGARPAHLCEQLTVSFEQAYSGLPGDQAQTAVQCNSPQSAVFSVELVRCVPTGTQRGRSTPIPVAEDGAEQTQSALKRMHDAQILMDGGMKAFKSQWSQSGIADVSVGAPEGGFQSVVLSVILPIGGN